MELYTKRQNHYRQLNNITVDSVVASVVKRFLFALSILILLLLPNNNAAAAPYPPEVRTVGVFELRFYSGSTNDYNYVPNATDNDYSDRPWTTEMIDTTVKYIEYWDGLIDTQRVGNGYKIVVNLRHHSGTATATGGGVNIVNIINNGEKPSNQQTDAMITIGGRFDSETVIHEFGHVLGITRAEFEPYLVDIYGEKYSNTNSVAIEGGGTDNDGVFNLYEDAADFKYPMFLGRPNGAIEELIGSVHNADGSLDKSKLDILAQSAIQGTSSSPQTGTFGVDLSHTGNMHSLMSYGSFINMPFVPEIELAMLEELGYTVDRRKAFGHSYYNRSDDKYDGDNNSGFVSGFGYDSDFMFGVGAHVFMDGLKLFQDADLSSRGEEGVGIRIDGSENTINVGKFINVEASGEGGVGLLAAWGRENVLINRGNISATGEGGIGVLLDVKGARSYYQAPGSSDARTNAEQNRAQLDLDGALVDRFDISGKITGNEYAILIRDTAHVKEINILNGAEIYGNIQSNYNDGTRFTALNFGKTTNPDGSVGTGSDPDFKFVLNDQLNGQSQFDITTFGGTTTIGENAFLRAKSATINAGSQFNIASNYEIDGKDKVYVPAFTLQANAILGINTAYSESAGTPFLNAGSATINANAKLDITTFKKGSYTVLSASLLNAAGFDVNDVLVGGQAPTSRHSINMTNTGNSIGLTLDATNVTLKWKGGNGIWDNGNKQWDNGGQDDVFIDGDSLIFDKGSGLIDVPVSVEAQAAAFASGANYRFTGAKIFVTDNLSISQVGTTARFNQDVQAGSLTVNNATLGIAADKVVAVQGDAEFNHAILEIGTGEANTSAGKIKVAGKAAVTGGVVNVYGVQRRGVQYLFLEAGGSLEVDPVAGGFRLGATADGRRGVVSYDAAIKKYWVTIDGLLVDHTRNALTSNQRNLGGYLNELSPRVNEFNDMNSVLMVFEDLSENSQLHYRQALDETSGSIYATAGSAGIQNITIANRTIATYLRRPPLSEVIPCHLCRGVCQHLVGKPTSWVSAIGMGGSTQSDSNSSGYSQSSGGSVFGVDIMRRVGCHLGIYGSAMENVLTSRGIREHSRSHEFMCGYYFRADNRIGYLLFNNGYGFNQYKTDRTMSEFGNRQARSSHNSFNATFYGELGTYYLDPIFRWHGYIGMQYSGVYQESVRERGAGALNIIGDPTSTTSFRSLLGVRTERFERTLLGGMISGDFNFAWMHECVGRIKAEFTGRFEAEFTERFDVNQSDMYSSLKYKVRGTSTGRDWAIFGASLGYDYGRLRFFGGYDAYLNGDQSIHSGTLGTVYVW
ncbi:MAG: autotransporter outer membrane beta-barrel domain-containing protein [Planctomycetaceae bacterium]|jgi:uncharacterized protein with beta-barrel porin domain|nr:autotransporter outer membrane beta-barrel domain-containing protein [Planctomycetaceae bacterium]